MAKSNASGELTAADLGFVEAVDGLRIETWRSAERAVTQVRLPLEKEKDILRRLGVTTDLDNYHELLDELWAAARTSGLSEDEFHEIADGKLHKVLEHEIRKRPALTAAMAIPPVANGSQALVLSAARCKVVDPILVKKRWKRGKWATKAGVGKNCIYGYLKGTRNPGEENHRAMAEALGLEIDSLPR